MYDCVSLASRLALPAPAAPLPPFLRCDLPANSNGPSATLGLQGGHIQQGQRTQRGYNVTTGSDHQNQMMNTVQMILDYISRWT
jgi:hypothetical protein